MFLIRIKTKLKTDQCETKTALENTMKLIDYKPDLKGEEGLAWKKYIEMDSKRPRLLVKSRYIVDCGSRQLRIDQ